MPQRGRQRRPGIKGRLDALQSHGHATMSTAQGAILAVEAAALGFMDQLRDGVGITLVRKGNASWMDFLTGKATEFPIGLKVDFGDEEEEKA
jgi:hypothetical protein